MILDFEGKGSHTTEVMNKLSLKPVLRIIDQDGLEDGMVCSLREISPMDLACEISGFSHNHNLCKESFTSANSKAATSY